MNKDKFIAVHRKRGYTVSELGNIVILEHGNYTAYWFFNSDGTPDDTLDPVWSIRKD